LGIKYLKDNEKTTSRIDIPGMVILGTSLGLLSYAAIDISTYGLNIRNSLELLLSISLWIPFYFLEKRVRSPLINFEVFREKHLLYSLLASFTQALGYLAVVFLLIMYLQGIRGFTPLIASIILLPGYILSSIMAPYMGKMADSKGPKNVATLGILLMALGVVLYAMLDSSSPVIYVSLITLITGLGAAMFWPSNNKAIMSSSPKQYYGVVSGVVRTLGSIGTLLSYVIAITVSSLAVPRYLAFQVFLGTNKIEGGLTETFLEGLKIAFLFSFVLLISAGILSYLRGDSNYE
jgi:MFS family permease